MFLDLRTRTNSSNITSHNGIRCGDASYFRREWSWNDQSKLGTVILLQDKYRPNVDISRDGIRQLPLELLCELELIREKISAQGFNIVADDTLYQEPEYSYISQQEYTDLLEKRPDFISQFRFTTTEGEIDAKQLHERVVRGECVELTSVPKRNSFSVLRASNNLIKLLHIAYLQNLYDLHVHFDRSRTTLHISTKSTSEVGGYLRLLPPAFFLPPTPYVPYLTSTYKYTRLSCNIHHKLSQFLVTNCETLISKVPGLFYQIMISLAEDDVDSMIVKINNILDRMRNLPELGIVIATHLNLEQADF